MPNPTRLTAHLSFFGVCSLIGVAVASGVHVTAYLGRPIPTTHPLFWIMSLGVFPPFFVMVFELRHLRWPRATPRLDEVKSDWIWRLPFWVQSAYLAAFANALAQFLFARITGDATGSVRLGVDVAPELLAGTIRLFSAFSLLFYLAPTIYFTFVPRRPAPLLSREHRV